MELHDRTWIRRRREILGISQASLASLVGVTQPMISAIEAGTRTPAARVSAAIEAALAIRPSQSFDHFQTEVPEIARRHGATVMKALGSTADGTDSPQSDLDLLVEFEPDRDIVDALALEAELQDLLTVPVDVVSANSSRLAGLRSPALSSRP